VIYSSGNGLADVDDRWFTHSHPATVLGVTVRLDWRRLMGRFGPHWRVLMSHVILFGFIYPGERAAVPPEVMRELSGRLERESGRAPPDRRLCQDTLLSREQYLTDI